MVVQQQDADQRFGRRRIGYRDPRFLPVAGWSNEYLFRHEIVRCRNLSECALSLLHRFAILHIFSSDAQPQVRKISGRRWKQATARSH